jgi:hypothetical protein
LTRSKRRFDEWSIESSEKRNGRSISPASFRIRRTGIPFERRRPPRTRVLASHLGRVGAGNEAETVHDTLWAAYNGVTDLPDHRAPGLKPRSDTAAGKHLQPIACRCSRFASRWGGLKQDWTDSTLRCHSLDPTPLFKALQSCNCTAGFPSPCSWLHHAGHAKRNHRQRPFLVVTPNRRCRMGVSSDTSRYPFCCS